MRGSKSMRVGFMLTVGIMLAAIAPAAQASCPECFQPDGRVRLLGGVLKGDNVYSTDDSQKSAALVDPGKTRQFVLSIQNDGTQNDSFKVSFAGFAGNLTDLTPTYVEGWLAPQDVTLSIHQAVYTTPTLAPGEVFYFRVYVHAASTSGAGQMRQDTLNVQSVLYPYENDRIAWRVTTR